MSAVLGLGSAKIPLALLSTREAKCTALVTSNTLLNKL